MQSLVDDPVLPAPPSYTEALMNQEENNYYEWCSALLHHGGSHYPHYQHHPLPSVSSASYHPISSSAHPPSFFHPSHHQLSHQHVPHHFLFDLPIKPHIQDFSRIQPAMNGASRDSNNNTKEEPSTPSPPPSAGMLPLHISPNSSPTVSPSMVSQALTPLPPMVAAVPPAAQHRTTTIPEFIHSPLGSGKFGVICHVFNIALVGVDRLSILRAFFFVFFLCVFFLFVFY
eukprot:Phypoly_transcript_05418.p1 GENE.Phypoly_transcript_05418~~Phypoly_transcript_05418.p1  ORF type:complete len:229 (+),score=45.09 Phypoly_transcript_05418:110-796(+)